jgi:hypothetical protein
VALSSCKARLGTTLFLTLFGAPPVAQAQHITIAHSCSRQSDVAGYGRIAM